VKKLPPFPRDLLERARTLDQRSRRGQPQKASPSPSAADLVEEIRSSPYPLVEYERLLAIRQEILFAAEDAVDRHLGELMALREELERGCQELEAAQKRLDRREADLDERTRLVVASWEPEEPAEAPAAVPWEDWPGWALFLVAFAVVVGVPAAFLLIVHALGGGWH